MKVLYYVPDITQKNGGIRQYACALLKILVQDVENQYFILHNVQDPEILSIVDKHSNVKLIPSSIGRERDIEKLIGYATKVVNEIIEKAKFKIHIKIRSRTQRICNLYKIDLVYCPYQEIPNTTCKTIVTLHDVQELRFPEFFSPTERLHRALIYKNITEKSPLIVVSYEHIKQDLITYFQRTNENVLVCLLDMRNLWFDKFLPDKIVSLTSYNLPDKFILYPSVTWPHKNHIGLLNSIAYLKCKYNLIINVVFTGHKSEYYKEVELRVKDLNLTQQVSFLGVVSEEVLYALYNTAQAVVVPTIYEAGSFPLMESILMQIPVVCSNVTSLPDVIGDEQYIFDPKDIVDMADKIKQICFNPTYREENIENSKKQALKLRNTGALDKLKKAIADLGSNN